MCASAIRTFYAYNEWANARVLDAAERIDREQLLARRSGGYGSLRDTLVHIVDAEWLYLERWRGRSQVTALDSAAFPDVASIRAHAKAVATETRTFVDDLSNADLERVVSYVNVHGETWAYPLWQQMLHQVNHATQHRSEAALLLTELGHSPGWLDFLIYIDELSGSSS